MDKQFARDLVFEKAFCLTGHMSILSKCQFRSIFDRFLETRSVPGDFIECGSFRGGLSFFMAIVFKEMKLRRKVHLFDSFAGLPSTKRVDGQFKKGQYQSNLLETIEFSRKLKLDDIVTIWPGWFSETLSKLPKDVRFSMAHLDADIYESTKDALKYVYPRINPGGVIIFDDFVHFASSGVMKAALEILGRGSRFHLGPIGQTYYFPHGDKRKVRKREQNRRFKAANLDVSDFLGNYLHLRDIAQKRRALLKKARALSIYEKFLRSPSGRMSPDSFRGQVYAFTEDSHAWHDTHTRLFAILYKSGPKQIADLSKLLNLEIAETVRTAFDLAKVGLVSVLSSNKSRGPGIGEVNFKDVILDITRV